MEANELLLKYINGNLNEAEKPELFKHYSEEDLVRIAELGENFTLDTMPVDVEWQKIKDKLHQKPKGGSGYVGRLLVMLSLLAVSVSLCIYFLGRESAQKTIDNTTTTEPMHIAMIDGTEIDLAPHSTISYNEDKFVENRVINLEGHAYFNVTKRGKFSVNTGDVKVEVLGTAFDIWSLSAELTQVECYSGVVQVLSNGSKQQLEKGNLVRVESGKMLKKVTNVPSAPLWMSGSLVFDKVALSDIYTQLESYYSIIFNAANDETKFSGTLPTNDITKALNVLSGVTGYTYTTEGNQVQVTTN